jgi:threonine/homoserine/homoserine lactone efflux protein
LLLATPAALADAATFAVSARWLRKRRRVRAFKRVSGTLILSFVIANLLIPKKKGRRSLFSP